MAVVSKLRRAATLVAAFLGFTVAATAGAVEVDKPAPEVDVRLLSGKLVKAKDLRGKVVMILSGEPDDQAETGSFDGRGATNYGRTAMKVAELLRRGAVGVGSVNPRRSIGLLNCSPQGTVSGFTLADSVAEVGVDMFRGAIDGKGLGLHKTRSNH